MPIIRTAVATLQDDDTAMTDNDYKSPIKTVFLFDWTKIASKSFGEQLLSIETSHAPSITSKENPSSPFSRTQSANAPRSSHDPRKATYTLRPVQVPAPPKAPLAWMWRCHVCRSQFPLHVTRRCLYDGHYYCSGDEKADAQRSVKRKKRGQSCSSEFDYTGWSSWGQWRRKALALNAYQNGQTAPILNGCENCDFPSQCRYEKRVTRNVLTTTEYLEPIETSVQEEANIFKKDRGDPSKKGIISEKKATKKAKKGRGIKLGLDLDADEKLNAPGTRNNSTNDEVKRFYSNTSHILSSTDLVSPTKAKASGFLVHEYIEQGKRISSADAENIEANLKAALAANKVQSDAQEQTQPALIKSQSMNQFYRSAKTSSTSKPSSQQQSLLTDFFKQSRSSAKTSDLSSTSPSIPFFPKPASKKPNNEAQIYENEQLGSLATTQAIEAGRISKVGGRRSKFTELGAGESHELETRYDSEASSTNPILISHSVFKPIQEFRFDFDFDDTFCTDSGASESTSRNSKLLLSTNQPRNSWTDNPADSESYTDRHEHSRSQQDKDTANGSGPSTDRVTTSPTPGARPISRWRKRRQHTHNISDWEDISLAEQY